MMSKIGEAPAEELVLVDPGH
ncbi:MAG: hypothetical protein QOI76_1436, partial [Frankiales bacterium]|nr:hypothetical protein [Frankiales bacterium]